MSLELRSLDDDRSIRICSQGSSCCGDSRSSVAGDVVGAASRGSSGGRGSSALDGVEVAEYDVK